MPYAICIEVRRKWNGRDIRAAVQWAFAGAETMRSPGSSPTAMGDDDELDAGMTEANRRPAWDQLMNRRQMLGGIGVAGLLVLSACTGAPKGSDAETSGGASGGSTKPKAPVAQLAIAVPDGSANLSPATSIAVSVTAGKITDVTVTDQAGAVIKGAPDATGAAWANTDPLTYGATYTVDAAAKGEDGKTVTATSTFTTITPTAQVFPSIGPLDGTTVGVGMPIRVYFDKPATDRKAVELAMAVTPTPAQTGSWNWISDTEVHWRPQVYWQAGSTVKVDVNLLGLDFGNGAWGKVNRSISFSVGDAIISTVDTGAHQMVITKNGAVLRTIPIAAGMEVEGRFTHNGVHVVSDKKATMTMDSTTYGLALDAGGYQTEVQWATRISNNGEFVHSAPWSIGDQGVRNVSHGCINASPENAKWFFDLSTAGDVVEVTGSPVPLTQADGDIFDWTIPWETWAQGTANK